MESTKILFGEDCPLPVRSISDPGSTHSFITGDVCEQLQSPIQPIKSKACRSNVEEFPEFPKNFLEFVLV